MTADLFERGVAYPLAVGTGGGIRESAGVERIQQSIQVILGTQHGERVMRPEFGCDLRSLAFAPNTRATANLARHLVEVGLTRWEPRIEAVVVDVENDYGQDALVITVTYRIKGTQDMRSLVFPLSLEQHS